MNLYFRRDTDELDSVSCTEKKFLQKYKTAPLKDHACFAEKFKEDYSVEISDEQKEEIKKLLYDCNPESELFKHTYG